MTRFHIVKDGLFGFSIHRTRAVDQPTSASESAPILSAAVQRTSTSSRSRIPRPTSMRRKPVPPQLPASTKSQSPSISEPSEFRHTQGHKMEGMPNILTKDSGSEGKAPTSAPVITHVRQPFQEWSREGNLPDHHRLLPKTSSAKQLLAKPLPQKPVPELPVSPIKRLVDEAFEAARDISDNSRPSTPPSPTPVRISSKAPAPIFSTGSRTTPPARSFSTGSRTIPPARSFSAGSRATPSRSTAVRRLEGHAPTRSTDEDTAGNPPASPRPLRVTKPPTPPRRTHVRRVSPHANQLLGRSNAPPIPARNPSRRQRPAVPATSARVSGARRVSTAPITSHPAPSQAAIMHWVNFVETFPPGPEREELVGTLPAADNLLLALGTVDIAVERAEAAAEEARLAARAVREHMGQFVRMTGGFMEMLAVLTRGGFV